MWKAPHAGSYHAPSKNKTHEMTNDCGPTVCPTDIIGNKKYFTVKIREIDNGVVMFANIEKT